MEWHPVYTPPFLPPIDSLSRMFGRRRRHHFCLNFSGKRRSPLLEVKQLEKSIGIFCFQNVFSYKIAFKIHLNTFLFLEILSTKKAMYGSGGGGGRIWIKASKKRRKAEERGEEGGRTHIRSFVRITLLLLLLLSLRDGRSKDSG